MDNNKELVKLFEKASLPVFKLGADGFPLPGPVVRYYREHMSYTDRDGKTKHWTQDDLAQRLGTSKREVGRMETQNKGLGSMDRRKALSEILKIPPALLGLASIEQLLDLLHGSKPKHSCPSKNAVGDEEIQLYQDALHVYKDNYEQGSIKVASLEPWIGRIGHTIERTYGKQKNEMLVLLWEYHVLAARTHSHDSLDLNAAMVHLNMAKQIASLLNDNELLAAARYHTGELYFIQALPILARGELDSALIISKNASPQTKGCVLTYTALAHAMTDSNMASATYVQKLLDNAEKYAGLPDDTNRMKFDSMQYLEDKADILIAVKQHSKATETLDIAEDNLTSRKRGIEYLNILRAECYLKQKRPEYDITTMLLSLVLEKNKNIQYYVNYVDRLYKLLAQSPYGNAPDVADLGMLLRRSKRK